MDLIELISELEKHSPDTVLVNGFDKPHSYRGYYDCVAFRPASGVSVRDMLKDALSAVGSTYPGYKGGEYTMSGYTRVYLADCGECGDELGLRLLRYMLADVAE
jgi:hypothetical protein